MKINYFLIFSITFLLFTLGCKKDDVPDLSGLPGEGVFGQVSGTWTKGKTYNITGHLEIPEGKSLTIEEGVKVVVTDSLLETEVIIKGELYCLGTEKIRYYLPFPMNGKIMLICLVICGEEWFLHLRQKL